MPATSKTAGRHESVPSSEQIVITTTVEKWRFKCPHFRHDDWRLWNGVFQCVTCRKLRDAGELDVDPVFDELWDDKEKQLVERERLRIEL